ncbi:hypothetical protein [Streptomyces albireticuli]|uniref:Lipoprotein n=1 Tax=Streptomyces albireticuli TaxID=1940 RepID=A0A2A2CVJ1_9ACTN|nr:hypothetical protein [Streptomyces albireticuli]MCD9142565.1 hypothetical protein [Streptomyces albireticuli]MCD9163964.1 hypothetical protein [Streptomyces albireticuli]MCD9192693.1 hypothetical protein [Streptomyces albireticuli]PAU44228.1 hypothetical protein CK936_36065 [Streptomyces albireticuli]
MRTRKAALVGALCVGLSAALTACGGGGEDPDAGTNGVGKLEPAKIQDKAQSAARGAAAVHLSGNVVSQGRTYKLDVRLKRDGGAGRVTSGADSFELLRVGDALFLKAPAAFWSHGEDGAAAPQGASPGTAGKPPGGTAGKTAGKADSAEAALKLEKKYVKVPSGDPSYQKLKGFTDKDVLLDGLLGLHGKLTRGEHGTVAGTRTIRVTGAGGSGGTLDVSLTGTPYPLRVQRAGGAGQLELADWGQDFALSVPSKGDTVDYGKAIPAGS